MGRQALHLDKKNEGLTLFLKPFLSSTRLTIGFWLEYLFLKGATLQGSDPFCQASSGYHSFLIKAPEQTGSGYVPPLILPARGRGTTQRTLTHQHVLTEIAGAVLSALPGASR